MCVSPTAAARSIGHPVEICVERDDQPVVGQIHHAEIGGVDEVGQGVLVRQQGRCDRRAVVLARLPVDRDVHAGHRFDRREVIAPVKGGRAAVVGQTQTGDLQTVLKIERVTFRQRRRRVQQRLLHLSRLKRARRFGGLCIRAAAAQEQSSGQQYEPCSVFHRADPPVFISPLSFYVTTTQHKMTRFACRPIKNF